MALIKLFRSPSRAYPEPVPPDAAVIDPASRLVLLSGVQCDVDGVVIGEGDYAEQVRGTMRNIAAILGDLGGSLSDLAKTTIYVNSTDIVDMNNAWDTYVEVMVDHRPPTTIVGVTLLGGGSAYLIEIEAIAALP